MSRPPYHATFDALGPVLSGERTVINGPLGKFSGVNGGYVIAGVD